SAMALCMICASGIAQTTAPKGPDKGPDQPRAACPPGAQNGPTIGRDDGRSLSDQLARSKGVICPPAGVDPEMHQAPPQGGAMKVLPPPGTPGGNPNVQPK